MAETNNRIEKSLSFIKNNLTHVDSVVDKLIESGVIPFRERDSIVSKPLERDQIQSIVDVVTRKKKGDAFLSALVETKNDHVADTIKSVKLSEEKKTIDRYRTYIKDQNNEDDAETYDKAKKELKNIKEENNHLKTLQKKLREQLEEKGIRLRKFNKVAIESQNKCKQLGDKTEVLQKLLNEKEEQVLALTDECRKLKTQIDQVEQSLKEKDEKIDTLSKNLNDVFKELQNQNENTRKILNDNEQHKIEVAELKKGNQELKNMCTSIYDELKAMKSERKPNISNNRPVPQWRTGTKGTPRQKETPRNWKK